MSVISGDTVKGSFHQGDSLHFSHETLGRQCMANAVAAAVYATMLPVHLWDTSSLDHILLAGDDLYRRRCNNQYEYLQFSDIHDTEVIFYDQYVINGNAPITGLVDYLIAPSPPFFTLEQAISSMENIQEWTYGVLTLADVNSGSSVLLCVKQGNYYIFDSHSRDKFGKIISNGTAVLLHMRTHNGFIKYIKSIADDLNATQFEITVLSPISSAYHRMIQPRQNSQKKVDRDNSQTNTSQTDRSDFKSTKNVDKREHSENLQNKRRSARISKQKEEHNEGKQYSQNSKKKENVISHIQDSQQKKIAKEGLLLILIEQKKFKKRIIHKMYRRKNQKLTKIEKSQKN